jgi:hypothetical protein
MKLGICIAVKNRSCVIVDKEDSLSIIPHVLDKVVECPELSKCPLFTKENQIVLLLLPSLLRSLANQKRPEDDWSIIVVDYNSSDIDMKAMLTEEVGETIPWHLEIITDYAFFDKGGGLAKAAEIAEHKFHVDTLFFCDADLLYTSHDLFDKASQCIEKNKFFYPILFSFLNPEHTKGFWRETGYGNFFCRLEDFKQTEGWLHNISWGWEDRALADSIPEEKKERDQVSGFFHQWHPFQWEFRVREYPVKEYIFKGAAVKKLFLEKTL